MISADLRRFQDGPRFARAEPMVVLALVLAVGCFFVILRWFGDAVLPRPLALSSWETAWLGAIVCCVLTELVGIRFTLSSTIAGVFGAALGYGYSLTVGAPGSGRRASAI